MGGNGANGRGREAFNSELPTQTINSDASRHGRGLHSAGMWGNHRRQCSIDVRYGRRRADDRRPLAEREKKREGRRPQSGYISTVIAPTAIRHKQGGHG